MYSGSKLNRGGRGPNRNIIHSTFQPCSLQRRQSSGSGHRNRSNTPASASATLDETFNLVRNNNNNNNNNNPLNFGMIIKLSPLLVDEIKRLEAQGAAAKIKFDSVSNNPAGNVIDVGGKEFRFTWSKETGDLCDIYEERRSGDDGDGLLVESGGAWRKLNVHRELDDTVKNYVKSRTVEAELKHKSRKAIVLDHKNPSMKTQMKALAAAEVNNAWRGSYKQKKEPPFKKMKADPSSASFTAVPSKSGGRAGFSSSTPSKMRASVSPLLSTPEQSGAPLSPLGNNNLDRVHTNRDNTTLTQPRKGNASISSAVQNKPTDLQSLLISLLKEKPHGMNLKALEKAIGETIPKSVKQIEPILKKIAVFQAPGRYILKSEAEIESFKKSLSESGSSPENNNHLREATAAPESGSPLKAGAVKDFEEPSHHISEPYEDLDTSDKIDIDNLSPDVSSDKKVFHNNEDPAVSSSKSGSDSDSDSESDSSDSESDSKSPVGSRSGSSSDSDSDASANSKQGSDEDVDIMSDDDKEPTQKLQSLDHELGYAHDMADEKDGHGSDLVDLEKDLFGENDETGLHVINNNEDTYADETTNLWINHLHHQESEVHDHAKRVASKNTFKRGSDEKPYNENGHVKRLKSGNLARPAISRSDGPRMMSRTVADVSDYEYANNHEIIENSTSGSPRSGVRSIDLNAQANPPADMDNIGRFSERGPQGGDVSLMQKDHKLNKETRTEDDHSKDRRPPKNSGGKDSSSHKKKHPALIEKNKEPELLSTSQTKDSTISKSTSVNGCRPTLLREHSDLEMGEFRENMQEEKRFERNSNSFKQSKNILSSDYWNLDESKGKPNDTLNPPKKVNSEEHVDDFTRFNGRQSLSRVDHVKAGSQRNKGRHNEAGASTINTDSQRKVNVDVPCKHDKLVPISTKDKKRHKSKDLGEKRKNSRMVNSWDNNGQKSRELESFSDDSITSYAKYEKEEPEMKGPIRDLSQYNEYVQEYREKYDCYHMLNQILESYKNKFQTFGRDLELAKGRDTDKYNKILEQLMESYRQCGTKHRRMKKIFVVLHHELQHLKETIRDFAEKQQKDEGHEAQD